VPVISAEHDYGNARSPIAVQVTIEVGSGVDSSAVNAQDHVTLAEANPIGKTVARYIAHMKTIVAHVECGTEIRTAIASFGTVPIRVPQTITFCTILVSRALRFLCCIRIGRVATVRIVAAGTILLLVPLTAGITTFLLFPVTNGVFQIAIPLGVRAVSLCVFLWCRLL